MSTTNGVEDVDGSVLVSADYPDGDAELCARQMANIHLNATPTVSQILDSHGASIPPVSSPALARSQCEGSNGTRTDLSTSTQSLNVDDVLGAPAASSSALGSRPRSLGWSEGTLPQPTSAEANSRLSGRSAKDVASDGGFPRRRGQPIQKPCSSTETAPNSSCQEHADNTDSVTKPKSSLSWLQKLPFSQTIAKVLGEDVSAAKKEKDSRTAVNKKEEEKMKASNVSQVSSMRDNIASVLGEVARTSDNK